MNGRGLRMSCAGSRNTNSGKRTSVIFCQATGQPPLSQSKPHRHGTQHQMNATDIPLVSVASQLCQYVLYRMLTQHKASFFIRSIHSHLKPHLADNLPFAIPSVNIFAHLEVAGPVASPSVAYSLSQVRIITSLPLQVCEYSHI